MTSCVDDCSLTATCISTVALGVYKDPKDIIDKFIGTIPHTACTNVKFAYLTKNSGKPKIKTGVYMRQCSGCAIYHSGFNNDDYIYFYQDLFKSKKNGSSEEIPLGSHITFGPKEGFFYLHNTDYILDASNKIGKARVCWYKIDNATTKLHSSRCYNKKIIDFWSMMKISVGLMNGGTGKDQETPHTENNQSSQVTTPTFEPGTPLNPTEQRQPELTREYQPSVSANTYTEYEFDYGQITKEDFDDILKQHESIEGGYQEIVMWQDEKRITHILQFPKKTTAARQLVYGGFKKSCRKLEKMMMQWRKQGNTLDDLFSHILTEENQGILQKICIRKGYKG